MRLGGDWGYGVARCRPTALRFRRSYYMNGCWSRILSGSQHRQSDAMFTSRQVGSILRCGIPQTGMFISRSHPSARFVTIPTPLACFRVHKNSLTILGSRDILDFRRQHSAIVNCHINKLIPDSRAAALRLSEASIEVNVALAAAVAGKFGAICKAIRSVLVLGPAGIARYLTYSRIIDRALPRLRAAVAGRF